MFHRKPTSGVAGEIMPGTLDMLILKVVSRGSQHGYSVAQAIATASDDALRVEEGALYPALHRLELSGLLVAVWGVSDNNRRAKFYKLTPAGRRQLVKEAHYWARLSASITRVMESA